jgi:flavin reductase (DIM6/NTAB) family NADH-FMN oxidoreductase RutF
MDAEGKPHGLTVSSFTSVSMKPPLVSICVGHSAGVLAAFGRARSFAVILLGDSQRELSDRFAKKGVDRFEGIAWRPGDTGAPLIEGALGVIECDVYDRLTLGDHDLIVGRVVQAQMGGGGPLVRFAGRYRELTSE